jgi:hypothetical protein
LPLQSAIEGYVFLIFCVFVGLALVSLFFKVMQSNVFIHDESLSSHVHLDDLQMPETKKKTLAEIQAFWNHE